MKHDSVSKISYYHFNMIHRTHRTDYITERKSPKTGYKQHAWTRRGQKGNNNDRHWLEQFKQNRKKNDTDLGPLIKEEKMTGNK